MATSDPLLDIRNMRTWFPIVRGLFSRTQGYVKAVDDVSFSIPRGHTVGLVGESGCGKTTLGRTLLGLEKATSGEARFDGQDLLTLNSAAWKPWRPRLQMIFQDPFSSLNPRLTVLDIITEGLIEHNLIEGSREENAKRLMNEVGLNPRDIYRYPHEFSGGQRQRISVARCLALRPEFIVCDETVSALDVSVQAQVINLLMDLSERYQITYLFISHDLSVVRHISHDVAVMYLGKLMEYGPTDKLISDPKHPYTQALVSAIPVPGVKKRDRIVLSGDVPSPANPPSGCPFHTRCPHVMPICKGQMPDMRTVEGRQVACHLYEP